MLSECRQSVLIHTCNELKLVQSIPILLGLCLPLGTLISFPLGLWDAWRKGPTAGGVAGLCCARSPARKMILQGKKTQCWKMKGCLCLYYCWVTPLSFCPVEGHQVGNLSPPFFFLAPVLRGLAGCNVQCCMLSPAAVAEAPARWRALLPGEIVAIATLERINTSTCTRAPLSLTQRIYYYFFLPGAHSCLHFTDYQGNIAQMLSLL